MTKMETQLVRFVRVDYPIDRPVVNVPVNAVGKIAGMTADFILLHRSEYGLIGLTWCCGASAKGLENYVGCRACFQEIDPAIGGVYEGTDIVFVVEEASR